MDQIILAIFQLVLDNPAIQAEVAGVVAGYIKSKLPTAADKALGDFFVACGNVLNAAPAPVPAAATAPVVGEAAQVVTGKA
jgi:hypothetical protein